MCTRGNLELEDCGTMSNEFSVGWICVCIIDIKIASGVLNGMTISSAKLEEQSAVGTYIY